MRIQLLFSCILSMPAPTSNSNAALTQAAVAAGAVGAVAVGIAMFRLAPAVAIKEEMAVGLNSARMGGFGAGASMVPP